MAGPPSPASDLNERLADLREEFRAESVLTMTVSSPPVTVHVRPDDKWNKDHPDDKRYIYESEEEPADQNGLNLSSDMIRLIGHDEGYGLRFAVRRGLHSWERHCRAHHGRAPDHGGNPAGATLLWAVIRDGFSVIFMARELNVSLERAERMLTSGIEHIDRQRERWETWSAA